MKMILERLQAALLAKSLTVATAESCTGGLMAAALTELPGSSRVFLGGISAYANSAKMSLLKVSADALQKHGAVSREVAESMARGARQALGADYAISTTGIAGPDGGTLEKPVGTVWCGFSGPDGESSELLTLTGTRNFIRERTVELALGTFLDKIMKL